MNSAKKAAEKMLRYFESREENGFALPSFIEFARQIGCSMHTLYGWREENADFAKAWAECEEILCERISEGALCKRLDGSFAKFLLTTRYGYGERCGDKPSEKATEKGGAPFTVSIVLKERKTANK